jgi:hypothetical protein
MLIIMSLQDFPAHILLSIPEIHHHPSYKESFTEWKMIKSFGIVFGYLNLYNIMILFRADQCKLQIIRWMMGKIHAEGEI